MLRPLPLCFALLALCSLPSATRAQDVHNIPGYHWTGAWGSVPSDPLAPGTTPVFNDQTVRIVAHLSLSAPYEGLRVHLTNALSTAPITFGSVHVAYWAGTAANPSSAIVPGTDLAVTFGGSTSVTLSAGGEAVSDPFSLAVPYAGTNLAVSIYVPAGNTTAATQHLGAFATISYAPGNQTSSTALANGGVYYSRPFLSGIDVATTSNVSTIVAVGDSITDGAGTTNDANVRWTDLLGARLQTAYGNQVGVVNAGIGSNQILLNAGGPNAEARFNRDVLGVHSVKYVILLEGINDINGNPNITSAQLIAGMRTMAGLAHAAGLTIYASTIMPYGSSYYYYPAGEQIRQQVNAFIRQGLAFDGVIDFDKAVADPNNPVNFTASLTVDGLHPNDAGSQVMANAINLALFNPATH